MRLLLDTNIFLEVLLDQEHAGEARDLLSRSGEHDLFVSDYSLHSIGLLLFRRGRHEVFRQFVDDVVIQGVVSVLALAAADTGLIVDAAQRFNLDFDDAYQHAAAERHGCTVVSFDHDFDRTERGRITPAEITPDA